MSRDQAFSSCLTKENTIYIDLFDSLKYPFFVGKITCNKEKKCVSAIAHNSSRDTSEFVTEEHTNPPKEVKGLVEREMEYAAARRRIFGGTNSESVFVFFFITLVRFITILYLTTKYF